MQAIRDDARAKAAAESDRIAGRDRSQLDDAEARLDAAYRAVAEARQRRNRLAKGGESGGRPDSPLTRARGVAIDDWETALDNVRAAEAGWSVAANEHKRAHDAYARQRPANPAAAQRAAAAAFDEHLAALPESLVAAVEHVAAMRALAQLAGRPIASLATGDVFAAVDTLIPAIEEGLRVAAAHQRAMAAQLTAGMANPEPRHGASDARPVNLDALNAQLAAQNGINR
ncbi:hypothetical protein DEI82_15145 [Curtobacterium sp. MCBD17_019]|nr:hypothetical protein DEI82_15145 [Curtobacterium sp. MCBD17_019]